MKKIKISRKTVDFLNSDAVQFIGFFTAYLWFGFGIGGLIAMAMINFWMGLASFLFAPTLGIIAIIVVLAWKQFVKLFEIAE